MSRMDSNKPVWAVIPAAGSGTRMQSDIAKQYLSFQGKTILQHCLDRLLSHPEISGAVVVLSAADDTWLELGYHSSKPIVTTTGGRERNDSVYRGLVSLQERCGDDVIALVHDAVRPLVEHSELSKVIDAARNNPAGAILAVAVNDTLKVQNDDMTIASTHSRERLWRALTPQVFPLKLLLEALQRVIDEERVVTDDAQAVESMGYTPALVASSAQNIKITRPGDVSFAEKIWLDQRDQQDNE